MHDTGLDDDAVLTEIEPFGRPGGVIIAPPVHVAELQIAMAWDSVNGGLAGVDTSGDAMEVVWQADVRSSMQPVVFPDSGFLTAGGDQDIFYCTTTTLSRIAWS
ncbi:MAG: hypothetical protein ABIP17_07810 [Ilumatobacteraceae bacterium]